MFSTARQGWHTRTTRAELLGDGVVDCASCVQPPPPGLGVPWVFLGVSGCFFGPYPGQWSGQGGRAIGWDTGPYTVEKLAFLSPAVAPKGVLASTRSLAAPDPDVWNSSPHILHIFWRYILNSRTPRILNFLPRTMFSFCTGSFLHSLFFEAENETTFVLLWKI